MKRDDMDADMKKLVQILKKILKSQSAGSELSKLMEQKGFNVNLCFLTLVAMTPEELDELEDAYESYFQEAEESVPQDAGAKLEFKLDHNDMWFLKENGIRF